MHPMFGSGEDERGGGSTFRCGDREKSIVPPPPPPSSPRDAISAIDSSIARSRRLCGGAAARKSARDCLT
jgi:hypothetical protein